MNPVNRDLKDPGPDKGIKAQRLLLDQLGIKQLIAVGGPSGGGMQALEWAVSFPDFMDKVFAVNSFGRSSAFFTMAALADSEGLVERPWIRMRCFFLAMCISLQFDFEDGDTAGRLPTAVTGI